MSEVTTMTFPEWLTALNAEAAKRGYAGAETFWQDSGEECWKAYWEEGSSPADALADDESYA